MSKKLLDRKNALKSWLADLKRVKLGKSHFDLIRIRDMEEELKVIALLESDYTLITKYLTREEISKRYRHLLTEEEKLALGMKKKSNEEGN